MFGLFRRRLENRIFDVIYPDDNDFFSLACPPIGPLSCNSAAVKAMAAMANFGLAYVYLTECHQFGRNDKIFKYLDDKIWEMICCDEDTTYRVSKLLLLEEDRQKWRNYANSDPYTDHSNLSTILGVVYAERIVQYQQDSYRDQLDIAVNPPQPGDTIFNYLAKRYESHTTGRKIMHEDKKIEDGFSPIITAYFLAVSMRLMEALK